MKTIGRLLIAIAIISAHVAAIMLLMGCALASARVTTHDPVTGIETTRSAHLFAVLNKSAVQGFKGPYTTKVGDSTMNISQANTETQEEVVEKIVEGVVTGVVKGIK